MAKFLKLTDANGGVFYSSPESWAKLSPTMTTGADKKQVDLTVIRYRDGTTDRVRERIEDLIRQVEKG